MKVFVTGSTGFLGDYIVKECMKRKYKITAFVHKENLEKKKNIISEFVKKGVRVRYGDITSFDDVKGALNEDYDIIFHLASVTQNNSNKNFVVDVIGTKNLFKAIKEIKIKRILYMSTTGVYGPQKSDKDLDENSLCKPRTNYEISKYKTEELVKKFCTKYKIAYIIIRSPRIYGPQDWQKTFLNYIKLVKMGITIVLGNLPISLVYIKNLTHGIFLSLRSKNETFIISNENTYTAKEIANTVEKIIKPKFSIRVCVPKIFTRLVSITTGKFIYGTNNVRYSTKKFKQKFHYKDSYSLEESLRETIAWYKNKNML